MWRTITRFRQSVSAYARINNETVPNPANNPHSTVQSHSQPWLVGTRQYRKCCCGSESKNGEERRDYGAHRDRTYFQSDWIDAVGLRCVLLFSWYMCQPLCLRNEKVNPAAVYAYKRLEKSSPPSFPNLVNFISNLIHESPVGYVLPTVKAVKSTAPENAKEEEESESFRNACDNLQTAHEKVTRSLENFLGTECMQAGKHDQAFAHFSEAAKSDDAPALFNLAICYEMGFGTKQSFNRAADLYKRAAVLGHATAMYNLGVFHVHGWGGVEADENKARKLFLDAANLGQIDAKRALYAEEMKESEDESESDCESQAYQFPYRDLEPRANDLTTLWYKALNINIERTGSKRYERLSSGDSGVTDLYSPCNLEVGS